MIYVNKKEKGWIISNRTNPLAIWAAMPADCGYCLANKLTAINRQEKHILKYLN